MRRPAAILVLLAAFATPGPVRAAACAPPPPPRTVAQQESLAGGALVRAVAGPREAPYLEILDPSCRQAALLGTEGGADASSLLRFRVAAIPGLPQPLVIVVVASPGGSDTAFSTQLIARAQGHYRTLLRHPLTSLLEGGVYVGPLGGRLGTGVAVWNFVWLPSETHVGAHRYRLQRFRWSGAGFVPLPPRQTRGKYDRPAKALAEWGVSYRDLTADLPGLANLR